MSHDYYKDETKKMSKQEKKMFGDYQGKMAAEEDLRILTEAHKIRSNDKRKRLAVACANFQKMAAEEAMMTENYYDEGDMMGNMGMNNKKKKRSHNPGSHNSMY